MNTEDPTIEQLGKKLRKEATNANIKIIEQEDTLSTNINREVYRAAIDNITCNQWNEIADRLLGILQRHSQEKSKKLLKEKIARIRSNYFLIIAYAQNGTRMRAVEEYTNTNKIIADAFLGKYLDAENTVEVDIKQYQNQFPVEHKVICGLRSQFNLLK